MAEIKESFWWAEGHEALEQDWQRGDFATWIDRTQELKAFGVEFDFESLVELLPIERQAEALRSISVSSNPAWLEAREARRFAYDVLGVPPISAGSFLVDQCRLGFLTGRAQLMQRKTHANSGWSAEEREWGIPPWFWQNFTEAGSSSQAWDVGTFKGNGRAPNGSCQIILTGVHFLRSNLEALAGPAPLKAVGRVDRKGGRPPKDWWDELWCTVWGKFTAESFNPKIRPRLSLR